MRLVVLVLVVYAGVALWANHRMSRVRDVLEHYISGQEHLRGTYTFRPATGEKESWYGVGQYVENRYDFQGLKGMSGTADLKHEWDLMVHYQDGRQERRQTYAGGGFKPRRLEWAEGFGQGLAKE